MLLALAVLGSVFGAGTATATLLLSEWEIDFSRVFTDNGPPSTPIPLGPGDTIGVSVEIPETTFQLVSQPTYSVYHLLSSEVILDFGDQSGRLHGQTMGNTTVELRKDATFDTLSFSLTFPRFEFEGFDWHHGAQQHSMTMLLQAPAGTLLSSLELSALDSLPDLSVVTRSQFATSVYFSERGGINRGWLFRSGEVNPVPEPGTALLLGAGLMALSRTGARPRSGQSA